MSKERSGDGGDVILTAGPWSMAPDGDLTIASGRGGVATEKLLPGRPGKIVFKIGDRKEMMVFHHNGKVIIRGEEIEDNHAIYETFLLWLKSSINSFGEGGHSPELSSLKEDL